MEMGSDRFLLRFFPDPGQQFDVHRHSMTFPPPGKIIGDEWYATGVLEDLRSRKWQLVRFEPRFQIGLRGFTILGEPLAVRCRHRAPTSITGNTGTLVFVPSLKFPPNKQTHFHEGLETGLVRRGSRMNAAETEVGSLKLRFLGGEPSQCQVQDTDQPLPRLWPLRISEALLLITARWHEWTIATTWTGSREVVCVRFPTDPEPSRLHRPIHSASPAVEARSWGIFQAALSVFWGYEAHKMHQFSVALRSAARASAGHVEALSVQLGIVIERILNHEFPELRDRVRVDTTQIASSC